MPNEPMRIAFKNGTLEWTEKGITWYDLKERSSNVYAFHYIDWNLKIQEIELFVGKEITVEDIEQLARRICPNIFNNNLRNVVFPLLPAPVRSTALLNT